MGAYLGSKTRYIEYQDGSTMSDGIFMDKDSTSFTAMYGAGKPRDCFQLNPDQNVGGCTTLAAVFCEITLFKDTHICLNKEFLSGVTLNTSTVLTVPSAVRSAMKSLRHF